MWLTWDYAGWAAWATKPVYSKRRTSWSRKASFDYVIPKPPGLATPTVPTLWRVDLSRAKLVKEVKP